MTNRILHRSLHHADRHIHRGNRRRRRRQNGQRPCQHEWCGRQTCNKVSNGGIDSNDGTGSVANTVAAQAETLHRLQGRLATYSTLFMAWMAASASDSWVKRTKPKPRLRPVSRSFTTTCEGSELECAGCNGAGTRESVQLLRLDRIPRTSDAG